MAMELDTEPKPMMIEHSTPNSMQIDPTRARFPCCIVWTPLPVISWLLPFVGHVGIGREDGVIVDFAGPNFVSVDNFAFGPVARYIQINKDKQTWAYRSEEEYGLVESGKNQYTWDDALKKTSQEYQQQIYSVLTCNCHSFVANHLNRLESQASGWNVVNVAALILLKGEWVDTPSMVRSYLSFMVVFLMGITFGGAGFLTFLAFLVFLLSGWYLCGTYYFKNIIQL
uniref:protein RTE1-HOMOLOG-like n=1 Tax=Erigeron canadensis TaxID=72917 RepID=UPI001CB99509|nr:protein RTE1-HOMOLOG-like [Erigeron canadensis]XP_043615378.1 protein RTE1-HOMOLOG-like [Erigeron canadensis]